MCIRDSRCSQHLTLLKNNKHSCKQLQKDFNFYGLNNFKFEIILKENILNKRLELEKKYITNTVKDILYNPLTIHNFKTQPRLAQRVKIHNTIYPSIREASRQLQEFTRNIGIKLNNSTNQDYQRLDYHKNIYFDIYKVKICNQIFESTSSVVTAGLAKTTRQVRDRAR